MGIRGGAVAVMFLIHCGVWFDLVLRHSRVPGDDRFFGPGLLQGFIAFGLVLLSKAIIGRKEQALGIGIVGRVVEHLVIPAMAIPLLARYTDSDASVLLANPSTWILLLLYSDPFRAITGFFRSMKDEEHFLNPSTWRITKPTAADYLLASVPLLIVYLFVLYRS